MIDMTTRTVFVTVGSTKFELLIETVLSDRVLRLLKQFGYRRCILQAGSGEHACLLEPDRSASARFVRQGVEILIYRYKSSLHQDLSIADLVISHAGSASIIESLEAGKRLIVVVNESLMDNHQFELAEKMFELGFLLFATCEELENKLQLIENGEFALKWYTPGNPRRFGNYLDSVVGQF